MVARWIVGLVVACAANLAAAGECCTAGLSDQEKQEGFVALFDGKDLDSWQGAKSSYAVKDGILIALEGKGGKLLTKKEYKDFDFRFEFKLTPGANNGVGIRTRAEGDAAYVGMEIQILDDAHEKYKGLHDYQVHGSIYGVVPAKRGFLNPPGQWNSEEIRCKGRQVTVTLNGHVIVDANLDEVQPVDGRKHPGLNNEKGYIGFLSHGDRLEFRNVRIKELP